MVFAATWICYTDLDELKSRKLAFSMDSFPKSIRTNESNFCFKSVRFGLYLRTLKRRTQLTSTAALLETESVYAELARRPIERDCVRRTECCQFKLTGRTPMLTAGEALVAAKALRAAGRKRLPVSLDAKTGACPMLDGKGKCLVYVGRPFGCRTHFCAAAGGPYSRREVIDLIRRLEEIDEGLGGEGPRALPDAVGAALDGML